MSVAVDKFLHFMEVFERFFKVKFRKWEVKNRIFGQKSKFWSNIEILDKNQNFGQTSKFWSKIGTRRNS